MKFEINNVKTPWLSSYGELPFRLDYPDGTMYDAVCAAGAESPSFTALEFLGRKISYSHMIQMIDKTARAFVCLGVKPGDTVTLCMPNVPQTVYSLYALNKIGAVASLIHPLSAENEIVFYLDTVNSKYALTLNQFYPKMKEVLKKHPLEGLIISSVADELAPLTAIGYKLTQGRKLPKVDVGEPVVLWKDFMVGAEKIAGDISVRKNPTDMAVILFSGGTTGTTKGIMLSNLNFNALAFQTVTMCNKEVKGAKMLAAMPMFHGFGLGVCVHTMLAIGGTSILVPQFNVKQYANLIKKTRPNYIAGVPTLYEAISRNPYLDGVSLDCLRGVFSGGDSLSVELKKKFDKFLDEHGSTVHIREGYGTTECVTASCLTPYNQEREGSIGLPYPDTYYQICKVGTNEEVPYGEEGEICLCGPSVMLGYYNNKSENADTLRVHEDGNTWLHTGDLGKMDSDGFIYFSQRIKRMIITSGYNVYPSQIENVIDGHPSVMMSCVIGIKDAYKMQKVKAFVVLKDGIEPSDELKEEILALCKKNVAKYALPKEIEFRDALPKTLVGKIAYTVLEKEENAKLS